MTTEAARRLEVHNVTKTFGGTKVLSGLSLVVDAGEIHGLVGENGSGKSTLVKILTGYHTCNSDAVIAVDGRRVGVPVRWEEVHAAGVSVVHQDLGLIDHLSVAENIGVGGYQTSSFLRKINWRSQNAVAASALARVHSGARPTALVASLSASQRAEVAIARALRDHLPGSGLIILDEATRSLSRDELARFHTTLRLVVDQGTSVLLVSHNLEEVLSLTDHVTVLRDGVVAGSALTTREVTEQEVARRMLGRDVATLAQRPTAPQSMPMVAVRGLAGDAVRSVDLTVGKGEVLGITGLPGSGFESIPYLLAAARPARAGSIQIDGDTIDLATASVRRCTGAGIALVPERRERDGLAFDLSLRDNLSLPMLGAKGRWWFVSKRWQQINAEQAGERFGIQPKDPNLLIRQFSGGNQQKALMAKWLSVGPKLLILHEPTQAVDVGARQDILRQIHSVADTGVSILLVSVETMDLAEACDRVLVYSGSGTLDEIKTNDPDEILDLVYSRSVAS